MEPAPALAPAGPAWRVSGPPLIPAAVGNWLFPPPVSAPAPPQRNLISGAPAGPSPHVDAAGRRLRVSRQGSSGSGWQLVVLQERPC